MRHLLLTTTLLFFSLINILGQIFQTPEEVANIKKLKIKSIRFEQLNLASTQDNPERDSRYTYKSIQLFDQNGRLTKQYYAMGDYYTLYQFYYNAIGSLDSNIVFYSKNQIKGKKKIPIHDSDYADILYKTFYINNEGGKPLKATIETGRNRCDVINYSYNDSGYLISQITTEDNRAVKNFTVNKWGSGIYEGLLMYSVSNDMEMTSTSNYNYHNRIPTRCKTSNDDGETSITHYNYEGKELEKEVFNAKGQKIRRFEWTYGPLGIEKTRSYRVSPVKTASDNSNLEFFAETIYQYETYP